MNLPAKPPRLRALLFFYSTANITGCALALAGPALLFAGVINSGWLAITAGLYAAGWLLGRRPPELERQIEDSLSIEETLARLDAIIGQARPYLDTAMAASLTSIRASTAEVLPRLLEESRNGAAHDGNLYTVRETVLRYLPETLANYAALPPAFRASHALKEGKTARELLTGQLALLDDKLREVVANVAASDAQALLANGQFLEMKFRQPDFLSGT